MSTASPLAESLHGLFENPDRGVVGLVDDLLRFTAEQQLVLEWHGERCRLRSATDGTEEEFQPPVQKSVFRAVLARIATLCHQQSPDSVSPYGGQAELSVGPEPAELVRIAFVNTADQQTLSLVPVGTETA